MGYILLSIVFSTFLFICFKWFDVKGIALIPAIAGNYIACILTGIIVDGGLKINTLSTVTIFSSLALGILFFLIFYAMGYASSRIGVGISSAASKLSLIIPVLFGAFILEEPLGIYRILALLLVVPAVMLLAVKEGEKLKFNAIGIPLLIFLGSGVIDTSLNILQGQLNGIAPSAVIILIFFAALICSLVTLFIIHPKPKNLKKPLLYGLILGVPNYFSVHFLMLALSTNTFTSGEFYLINNAGVIFLSFVMAAILFSEKINKLNRIGLLIAILSIYLVLKQ